ncbi:MAG: hypothetical protein EOP04_03530 [Proteobacteria bacterium]|nr:MAG: hypothetical protein EOP04_03530 [Pseudomonadota bacterium]
MKHYLVSMLSLYLLTGCLVHDVKKPKSLPGATVVVHEGDKLLQFSSIEEFAEYVDSPDFNDCVKNCIFQQFSGGTADFMDNESPIVANLTNQFRRPYPKVVEAGAVVSEFNIGSTVAYGFLDELKARERQLSETCAASIPVLEAGKDLSFGTTPSFSNALASGIEQLSGDDNKFDVITNMTVMGRANQLDAGAEVSISLMKTQVTATAQSNYVDYSDIKGEYQITYVAPGTTNRALAKEVSKAGTPPNVNPPSGMVEVTTSVYPATGYLGSPTLYVPSDKLCSLKPAKKECVWERERNIWICDFIPVKGFSEEASYKGPAASSRIAVGAGELQCNDLFPDQASSYGLGANWKVPYPSVQYFISDAAFPGCAAPGALPNAGMNCGGLTQRTSELDNSLEAVEPASNFCINRWKDYPWATYRSATLQACKASPVYVEGIKTVVDEARVKSFMTFCGNCNPWFDSLKDLNEIMPIGRSEFLVAESIKSLTTAREQGYSFLMSSDMLTTNKIRDAKAIFKYLIGDLALIQNAYALSDNPDWITLAKRYHELDNLEGFNSLKQTAESLDRYKKLFDTLAVFDKLELKKVGCSYEANGRIRKYDDVVTIRMDDGEGVNAAFKGALKKPFVK